MNMFRSFFMVWCEGGGAPTCRHNARDDAKREAARLALSNPGHRFYVLEALEACEKMEVAWIFACDEDDCGVPF